MICALFCKAYFPQNNYFEIHPWQSPFLFLLLSGIPLGMHHNLLVHSPIDGHLDSFKNLAFTNEVAINISVRVFIWT